MTSINKNRSTRMQWVKADETILTDLRPGAPFNARASFKAFGERQFGGKFAGVACCCELPGNFPPRWEAALELNKTGICDLLAPEMSVSSRTNAEPE
jgi:hypothetical protein